MESIGAGGAGYERAGVMAVIEVEIGPGPVPGQFGSRSSTLRWGTRRRWPTWTPGP
jgi:hypothetical protein